MGVIQDVEAGQLTAVLRVTGDGQFSLTSPDAQDTRLAMWGDALAGFCRERRTVCRIAWQEWSTSTMVEATPPVGDGTKRAARQRGPADYLELVTHAAPRSVSHDTLLSLTVDLNVVRARSGLDRPTRWLEDSSCC